MHSVIIKNIIKLSRYSVAINFPYAGCLVPERFEANHRVPAIMLEVNRRLYLKPACMEDCQLGSVPLKTANFENLRNDVWAVMLLLAQEAQCLAGEAYGSVGLAKLVSKGVQK